MSYWMHADLQGHKAKLCAKCLEKPFKVGEIIIFTDSGIDFCEGCGSENRPLSPSLLLFDLNFDAHEHSKRAKSARPVYGYRYYKITSIHKGY